MITNNEQYKRAKKEITLLKELISDIEVIKADKNIPTELKLQLKSSKRHLQKLESQVSDYKKLTSDALRTLEFDSNKDNMNNSIMSFRIASKQTQTKIAELLYLHPQQIQRYEQDNYLTASFERILQLLEALDVQIILRKEFHTSYNFITPNSDEIKNYKQIVHSAKQLLAINDLS
ncbi:helix-turn-helix transcriptional regulator [Bacteroides sp. 519]|uniref:helix-turn-helix domain-containing protein n=1 Tax=Bacteroides sp. 519 TaxID=2302937 RepID=UPI0013D77C0E|nr:helix-turn-helix transcriptional regulator [Bacteroides sp. 519]NDV58756.1 helix-turn-helix domain-containing protein [Bacteroides sp. 519]